jgi:PEP-CTERM motif
MRVFKVLALVTFALTAGPRFSQATIIDVEYTGTFTGSWSGNYDPLTGPSSPYTGYSSGSYSTTPFTLTFQFDTNLAQPGYFDNSQLSTPPESIFGNSIYPNFPSVGFVTLSSSLFNLNSGNFTASDTTVSGSTSQSASSLEPYKYGLYTSTSVRISAQGTYIPDSILEPFEVSSTDPIGFGNFDYDYNGGAFGGGQVQLSLSAYTLEVTTMDAVPEPSSWAMLLIGFAGIGFSAYRRHQFPNPAGAANV